MDEFDTVTTDAIPQCTFLLAQGICHKKKQQQGGHVPWKYHGMNEVPWMAYKYGNCSVPLCCF